MKIHLLNESWEIANSIEELEPLMTKINNVIKNKSAIIQRIYVDGIDLNEDFLDYVTENIRKIDDINIHTIDERTFINQLISTSSDYLERALPDLVTFTNELYKGLNDDIWNKFSTFIEGLEYIIYTISSIRNSSTIYVSFDNPSEFLQNLNITLHELMEAAEDKNNSLMADLLSYEISPQLDNLFKLLNHTIDCEVKRNDLQ